MAHHTAYDGPVRLNHGRSHAGASRGTGPGWKRWAPADAPAGKILVFWTLLVSYQCVSSRDHRAPAVPRLVTKAGDATGL